MAGAALALLPGHPVVTLDPELALTLLVAPVLLDAAFDSSPRDLKQNWRAVTGLALAAVGLTVAAVALIGALASCPRCPGPRPSRSAPSSRRRTRPRRRPCSSSSARPIGMLVILEGESLFNDASALLIYRLAVTSRP